MAIKNRLKSTFINLLQTGTMWECINKDNWAIAGNVKNGYDNAYSVVIGEGDFVIVLEVVQTNMQTEKFVVCYSQWQGKTFSTQISHMKSFYAKVS